MKLLALGETHHGTHNQEIQKVLESNDFDVIFYELPNNFQKYIEEYKETSTFSERLERYIKGASKEGNDLRGKFELIFNYSKETKTPVICIDSSKEQNEIYKNKSEVGNWYLRGESRDEDMFLNIKDYLENNQTENALLICGANHLTEGKHLRTGKDTLGTKLKGLLGDNLNIKVL